MYGHLNIKLNLIYEYNIVRLRANFCEICGGCNSNRTCFSPNTPLFPSHYHLTKSRSSSTHIPLITTNRRSLGYFQIKQCSFLYWVTMDRKVSPRSCVCTFRKISDFIWACGYAHSFLGVLTFRNRASYI